MLVRSELKEQSKLQLQGKWAVTGGLFLLLGVLLIGIRFIPIIGGIMYVAVMGPITLSYMVISLKVTRGESLQVEDIFEGFKNFIKALGLMLWQSLWTILWSLLLIIPGIIKAYSYSMAFYILADNPDMGIREALRESMRITDGYKWDLFVLGLSFIGWSLLASITLGIGYFWLSPYMQVTYANTYNKLKQQATN